jgi:hypothetical protein
VALADNRVTGDVVTAGYTSASFADKNVAMAKAVSVSGIAISGTDAGNYLANTTASTTANITTRNLTVAAVGISKGYDGGNSATVTLTDNRVVGDTFTDSYMSATFSDKNVGTGKVVSVSGISISGADAGNYSANATASTTAAITARSLTVTATGVNKIYDGSPNATVTLADNRVSGDVVTDAYASASFSDKNVGSGKTVSVGGISISGVDALNYSVNPTASTTANITPKPIVVMPTSGQAKVYGTVDPPLAYTYSPLATGDTNAVFSGALGRAPGDNVGTYAINLGNLSAGANYNTTLSTTPVTFAITKAYQAIAFAPLSTRVYGDLDFQVTAIANSGLPVSFSVAANPASPAVCSIVGSTASPATIHIGNVGTCTVTASQLGDGNHFGATPVVQPFNANSQVAWPAGGLYYTGASIFWTTSANTSTASLFLSATVIDPCEITPKPAQCTGAIADVRNAKVSFYTVSSGVETAITGATNLPVGLVNTNDIGTGSVAATVQYNLGNGSYTLLNLRVKITGAYYSDPSGTDTYIAVAKPTGGNLVMGAGSKVMNTEFAGGTLKPIVNQMTDVEFNVTYTKSSNGSPSNPQGKVSFVVRSDRNASGAVDGRIHTYVLTSTAISTLQINQKQALSTSLITKCQDTTSTPNKVLDAANYDVAAPLDATKCYDVAVFTAKATVQEQNADGSLTPVDGGTTMQFSLTDGDIANLGSNAGVNAGVGDYFSVQVNNSKTGGVWFTTYWDGAKTRQTRLAKGDSIVQ